MPKKSIDKLYNKALGAVKKTKAPKVHGMGARRRKSTKSELQGGHPLFIWDDSSPDSRRHWAASRRGWCFIRRQNLHPDFKKMTPTQAFWMRDHQAVGNYLEYDVRAGRDKPFVHATAYITRFNSDTGQPYQVSLGSKEFTSEDRVEQAKAWIEKRVETEMDKKAAKSNDWD